MSATIGTNGPAFMGTFTTSGNPIYRPAPMTTQPSATPICTACGNDQGIVRSLGRDNDEIISYCPVCCPHPSATPEPYAHEWHITVKADEHAGAIDALFNCIKAWQSGSEPIGGTCPRSMGNRQTYDVVKGGREGRTLEIELAAAQAECERLRFSTEGHLLKTIQQQTELARLRAENERLVKQVKDDNRAYGCELRDPNGTIWEQAAKDHARAERAEAALAAARKDSDLFEAFRLSASYSEHVKAYVIKNKNGTVLAIGENLRLAIRDALAIK